MDIFFDMKREDLLTSPYYWLADIQLSVCQVAQQYMIERGIDRNEFAVYLGVSKRCVSQLLNGNYNCSIEKLTELLLKLGYVPRLEILPIDSYESNKQGIR